MNEFKGHGVNFTGLSFDLDVMMKKKQKAVTGLTGGIEGLLKKNKVDYVKGWGKFSGTNSIEVDGNDGKKSEIRAKNIIIATGSEPSPMPGNIIKIDEKIVVSSTGALDINKVPKKMIVVGGGVIGLELGSVWRRLGTEVTVVEFMPRILPNMDHDMTKQF
jgi:dihydrolipoamide dehydrogenase